MHSFATHFWLTVQIAISSWARTLRLILILLVLPLPSVLMVRAISG
jgi:hypothetical protein